jgi:hypothetical protein
MKIKKHVEYSAVYPEDAPRVRVRLSSDDMVTITLAPNSIAQRTVDLPYEAIELAMRLKLKVQDLDPENCYIKR